MKEITILLRLLTLCVLFLMAWKICDGFCGVQKVIYTLASVESARLNREYGYGQRLQEGLAEIDCTPHSKTNVYIVTSGGWKEGGK